MKNLNKYLLKKFNNHIDINEDLEILHINKIDQLNISNRKNLHYIINFEKTNNIRRINKFHNNINDQLNLNDIYISCLETLERREKLKKENFFIFRFLLTVYDFLIYRILPKISIFKQIYFFITRGKNRVISKTESLGRLISCGFEIVDYFEHNNIFYIISKKIKEPDYNNNPSYGVLFKMKRIGYKGKIIYVYKLRTMYPYSEYCQDLIMNENNLDATGKIMNDYRVTFWGKFIRRFWLDELPMLINFFKRELNLVGVRPLSQSYFNKYPKHIQNLRIKVKPGLLPPFYADLPKNFDEILISEKKYLEAKLNNPLLTDIKYFFSILANILFKGARSK